MKKLFISADIEGVAGIAHWDETDRRTKDYAYFAEQMTNEVRAACEGAIAAGIEEIYVKDAHGSARNINPAQLPECAVVYRGWGRHPFGMVFGLDQSFHGAVFTGYHSASQMSTNPLAHTISSSNNYITINGELCSELMINCLAAAYLKVPVFCVSGDKGLCDWIQTVNPRIETVPVSKGIGNGSVAVHPRRALRLIKEGVQRALQKPREDCMYPFPRSFEVEVNYKEHHLAYTNSFYPGASLLDTRTITYQTDDYFDVLRFFQFVL